MLKQKLAQRLQSREKTLLDSYEDRLKQVLDSSPNKLAAKLKKAALMHKRTVAIEQFRSEVKSRQRRHLLKFPCVTSWLFYSPE